MASLSALPACHGDCLSFGYPAISLTVVDAATAAPIGLGNAVLKYTTSDEFGRAEETSLWNGHNDWTLCCVSGRVRLYLEQQGYIPWDTTVVVRTSGYCDIPVLKRITVRLRRAGS